MSVWRNVSRHSLSWQPGGSGTSEEIVPAESLVVVSDDRDYSVLSNLGPDNVEMVDKTLLEGSLSAAKPTNSGGVAKARAISGS